MRDVLDDEGRRFGPASLLALTAMALMSVSILYNSLFAQPGGNRTTAGNASNTSAGATTRIDVPASSAARNTIQLKYDPIGSSGGVAKIRERAVDEQGHSIVMKALSPAG